MIVFSVILIAALTFFDQLSKYFVLKKLDIGEVISIFKIGGNPILSITHERNSGAAWSTFSTKTELLTIVTSIIIILLLILLFLPKLQKKVLGNEVTLIERISFCLVIAGGLGNIIDRLRFKEVVDFIKTDFIDFPIFNFADICVVVGCILFIINIFVFDLILNKLKANKAEDSKKEAEGEGE
ncbi:MAG: signal peptidase II [Clostridiales bacterium]|nr:signal peptidase II [Clostridiales bacterium]